MADKLEIPLEAVMLESVANLGQVRRLVWPGIRAGYKGRRAKKSMKDCVSPCEEVLQQLLKNAFR